MAAEMINDLPKRFSIYNALHRMFLHLVSALQLDMTYRQRYC